MISITENSINSFCPNGRVVVYGFGFDEIFRYYGRLFGIVQNAFQQSGVQAYSWKLNHDKNDFNQLIGGSFFPLQSGRSKTGKYKTALVTLVLDNYRRRAHGEAITPLVFCLDVLGNSYPPTTPETIFAKEWRLNRCITHKELRRIAKLCFDERVDRTIREVARETFKYVRVNWALEKGTQNLILDLEEMHCPFTERDFQVWHAKRREGQNPAKEGTAYWRSALETIRQQLPPIPMPLEPPPGVLPNYCAIF